MNFLKLTGLMWKLWSYWKKTSSNTDNLTPVKEETEEMKEPVWLVQARKYIGVHEQPGPKSNDPNVVRWWTLNKLPFKTDEIAWCANFVGGILHEVGMPSTNQAKARSYMKFGSALKKPAVGAIVVFWRGSPKGGLGHVGFVVGKDQHGHIMVLGGNQSDAVNIKPFATDRVLGYRWPTGKVPLPERYNLPIVTSDGKVSVNES